MFSIMFTNLITKIGDRLGVKREVIENAKSIEDLGLSNLSNNSIALFAKIKEAQRIEEGLAKKINLANMEEIKVKHNVKEKIDEQIVNDIDKSMSKRKKQPEIEFSSGPSIEGPGL